MPIPTTPELDPLTLLTDAADVATWSNQGLPSDRTSIENATILCNTERWPLVVDAQLQGIKWIKNKYGEDLRAIRLGQRRWAARGAAGSGWTRRCGDTGSAGRGGRGPTVPGQPRCRDTPAEAPRGPRAAAAGHTLALRHISPLGRSYLDAIERAVAEGQTLLIEDVGESMEPVLDHLLGRNTIKKGRSAPPVLWC